MSQESAGEIGEDAALRIVGHYEGYSTTGRPFKSTTRAYLCGPKGAVLDIHEYLGERVITKVWCGCQICGRTTNGNSDRQMRDIDTASAPRGPHDDLGVHDYYSRGVCACVWDCCTTGASRLVFRGAIKWITVRRKAHALLLQVASACRVEERGRVAGETA